MKIIRVLVVGVLLIAAPAHAGGIPVVDSANLAQSVQQLVQLTEQLKQMQEQVKTAKDQLKNAKETFESLTEPREMLNSFDSLYANLKEFNTEDVLDRYGLSDPRTFEFPEDQEKMTNEALGRAAEWLAKVEKLKQIEELRVEELKIAAAKVDGLEDMKDAADFQARMLAELALMGNEQLKTATVLQEAQAKKDMEAEKHRQIVQELIYRKPTKLF